MTDWPVLASLSAEEVRQILTSGRRRLFSRGETIFQRGDPAYALHLIDRGHVAVRAVTSQGDQAILAVLGPGDVFGELALIDHESLRTATVTAVEACETITLHRTQFESLRASHPGVDRFLLASLSVQIARMSDQLLEILFVPTRLRLIRQLLNLARQFDGPIPLTQEELALLAGTTRPTANETLRELERSGVIQLGRARVEVLHPEQLVRRLARAAGS